MSWPRNVAERDRWKFQLQIKGRAVVERDFYDTREGAIALRKVACSLQPSTTSARAGQANTRGIRGKVGSICGAKVGATDGNDGKQTKDRVDHDGRNLISGGSAVGYWLAGRDDLHAFELQQDKCVDIIVE